MKPLTGPAMRSSHLGALAFGICLAFSAIGRATGESYVVFLPELSANFGWARSEATSVYGIMLLTGAPGSLLIGYAFDRLGPRFTFTAGLLCMATGLVLASVSDTIWHFQLCVGIVFGLGLAALGPVSNTALISRWFDTRLNTRLGLVWASGALGILLAAPTIQILIDAVGWRSAYRWLAGLCLVLPIALSRLPWSALAEGRPDLQPARRSAPGPPGRFRPLATRTFVALAGVHFLTASAMFSIHPQTVAIFLDSGVPALIAASAFGMVGAAGAAGTVAFGWTVDRAHRLGAILFTYALSIAGVLLLLPLIASGNAWLAWAFAFTFGTTLGARGPILAATAANVFGPGRGLATIVGAMYAIGSLGGAFGSVIGGLLRDFSGSYAWTIAWATGMLLVPPVVFLLVPELRTGRPPARI